MAKAETDSLFSMHRVDLQQELLRLVRSEVKSQGDTPSKFDNKPGISLQLNSKVVKIDPNLGRVELEDGTIEEADLVVAADGVHSAIRQSVFGSVDFSARASNMSAFRFFIPRKDMMNLEAGRRLVEWNASHTGATMFVDTTVGMYERYIAWYDVSGSVSPYSCPRRFSNAS